MTKKPVDVKKNLCKQKKKKKKINAVGGSRDAIWVHPNLNGKKITYAT